MNGNLYLYGVFFWSSDELTDYDYKVFYACDNENALRIARVFYDGPENAIVLQICEACRYPISDCECIE